MVRLYQAPCDGTRRTARRRVKSDEEAGMSDPAADVHGAGNRGKEQRRMDEPGAAAHRGLRRWRIRKRDGDRLGQVPMSWRSLPGLNRMVRPGGIRTSLPGARVTADAPLSGTCT